MQQTLKQARLAKGLKQSDVAETIGCAATSITHWETGRIKPPLDSLEKMCEIYGISPLDLLNHYPTINEIHEIVCKPIADRSYEETVALNFSGSITGWPDGEEMRPDEIEVATLIKNLHGKDRKLTMDLIRVFTTLLDDDEDLDDVQKCGKYRGLVKKIASIRPKDEPVAVPSSSDTLSPDNKIHKIK